MRIGVWIAGTAVVVMAPRLLLAYLEVDGIELPAGWRAAMLAISAVASAVVLTGGGAYLAHVLATHREYRGVLALIWTAMLLSVWVLVAPLLVAHMPTELAATMPGEWGAWLWASVAVLSVELLAAGAVVAAGAQQRRSESLAALQEELLSVARERDVYARQLASDAPATGSDAGSDEHRCPGCQKQFTSRFAMAGHRRHCQEVQK